MVEIPAEGLPVPEPDEALRRVLYRAQENAERFERRAEEAERRLRILTESAEKVAQQNSTMLAAMERSTDPDMRALAKKIQEGT